MKVAVLTSSRADYGIYLPLLKALKNDSYFSSEIIAFGTHLSPFHGYTLDTIKDDGFNVKYTVESMVLGDSPNAVSTSIGITTSKFADFWKEHQTEFDIVFCLGDRYEMFAAVVAGIPYNITFAHLHGGEKTLGAIDNIFRHTITLSSKLHFVSCSEYGQRVAKLTEITENIFNVGALSIDNLSTIELLSAVKFQTKFGIDLSKPTILATVHPETVAFEKNEVFGIEFCHAMQQLKDYQVLITLPNADTNATILRKQFLNLEKQSEGRIICVENLGSQGYFSAMKLCALLVGNTSSGILEAASFGKWVINLGDRQKGRAQSDNIINVPFDCDEIKVSVNALSDDYNGQNIYFQENPTSKIINELKRL